MPFTPVRIPHKPRAERDRADVVAITEEVEEFFLKLTNTYWHFLGVIDRPVIGSLEWRYEQKTKEI